MPQTLQAWSPAANILTPVRGVQDARWTAAKFGPSLTIAAGTVLGKKTADGLLYPYASGNADGTQVAVGLSMYSIWTDAASLVYLNGSAVAGLLNFPDYTAPYYYSGIFDSADLTGWDATAKSTLGAQATLEGFFRLV